MQLPLTSFVSLGASDVEPRAGVARILIDCSGSGFDGPLTGIPRVVRNYVKHGGAFGRRNGVRVVPVELAYDGRLRARNVPEDESAAPPPSPSLAIPAKVALELIRYFTRIAVAVLGLFAAVFPLRAPFGMTRALPLRVNAVIPWARSRMERAADRVDPGAGDVVLCPNHWHEIDPAHYEAFRARGAEIVFVIHDILPVTQPAYYPYPWRWTFEKRLSRSLDYVSHYYCISGQTLLELTEFAARRGKTIRASIAYNGFEPSTEQSPVILDAAHAKLLERRPWLMVGSLEPKKGQRETLAAFDVLWSAGYQRPLVVIGRPGWMFEDIVETFKASRWLGDRFFWFDNVGDKELVAFYRGSHALLFASFAEGFGLPLIEAMSRRLPILARDVPTTREILGPHGAFFTTSEELANGVKSLEDPVVYGAARDKVTRSEWFDWSTVVDAVMADILLPPEERRNGANLLSQSLVMRNPLDESDPPPAASACPRAARRNARRE